MRLSVDFETRPRFLDLNSQLNRLVLGSTFLFFSKRNSGLVFAFKRKFENKPCEEKHEKTNAHEMLPKVSNSKIETRNPYNETFKHIFRS